MFHHYSFPRPSRPNGWTDRVQIFFKRRVLTLSRVHAISIFDQIDSFRSAIENDRFLADFALWSDIAAERFDLAGCFLVELLILTSSTRKSDPDPDRIIGSRDIAFSVFLEYLRNGSTGDIELFFKRWANMSSIQRWLNRPDRLNRSDVRIIYIRPVCFRSKCISSLIFYFFRRHCGFL